MKMTAKITVGISILFVVLSSTGASGKETHFIPKKSNYEAFSPAPKGGTLYDSLSNNPKVLNPILSADTNSRAAEGFLWASLFDEDGDTLQPLPYLATSYSISADRKVYTFKLNPEAKWQDGTKVTTADVKFTFDTFMNPKVEAAALRTYWEGVTVNVIDEMTFSFAVVEPKFDTLRSLYLFQPIQKKQFEGEADFNKARGILQPVGNGPFEMVSFSRDQKLELKRVENWWGSKLGHLKNRFNMEKIVFRIVTDPNLVYERWLKKDLDIINFQGPGNQIYATRVKGSDKALVGETRDQGKDIWATEIKNKAPRGFSYIGWNQKIPMFQSAKTRQALSHLVDYQQIIDKVFFGFQVQSTSPFGSLTLNSDPSLRKPGKILSFDLKKALALLKADGWSDSQGKNILSKKFGDKMVDFKFTLKTNSNNPARVKIAQILKENFKAAGIDMEIRSMEWNAFLDDVDKRNYEALILAWSATPYPNPKQTWHTDSEKNEGSNLVSYSNKTVDGLIEKANVETDLNKRAKILHEINRIIYEDQPYTFLLEPRSMIVGFNKKVMAAKKGKDLAWAMQYSVDPSIDIYGYAP